EETQEFDEGPFLKEERSLINSIAKKLVLIIIKHEENKENKILTSKLIHADRLAIIGELTAGITHEINEPLGNILGFAQLIKKENVLSTQAKSDLDKIINEAIYATEIIKKLMTFSKYDEKGYEKVCLNTILTDGIYMLESMCKKENIEIIKTLEEQLPNIFANPIQINQVIVNLCVNAIQVMPSGGKLILNTFSNKENIILVVQDTGTGISEENLSKIFNPFFTTKDSNMNTGLGLSVVHGIISSHNGLIKVESNLGVGTRFEITFPKKYEKESKYTGC
ncbi:sensor histidine kinase, partial [Bacteroidota bacterium]